jgi:hypothetical protein
VLSLDLPLAMHESDLQDRNDHAAVALVTEVITNPPEGREFISR